MPEIHLVRVGNISPDIIDFLLLALPDSLGLRCLLLEDEIDPAPAFYPPRQQYNSMDILLNLVGLNANPQAKVLGLASVDLFIPILTFVFGQAQLNNRNALMSVHRLHQDFYGLPEDEELLYARAEKEALHELGHTFGLIHCPEFECVMYLSNSIEQVDMKSSAFCDPCRGLLEAARGATSNY
jgi:archaemetzincin